MIVITEKPAKRKSGVITTVEIIKKQLNIETDFEDDDQYISMLLDVAIETLEDDTHSDILNVENTLEYTPPTDESLQSVFRIVQAPCNSVSKVEVYDGSTWSTISADDFEIQYYFAWFEITFDTTPTAEKIRFTFNTGYTDATRPQKLKFAAILKAADLYDTERSNYAPSGIFDIKTYERALNGHVRTYY